jgi:hypothetical protein
MARSWPAPGRRLRAWNENDESAVLDHCNSSRATKEPMEATNEGPFDARCMFYSRRDDNGSAAAL